MVAHMSEQPRTAAGNKALQHLQPPPAEPIREYRILPENSMGYPGCKANGRHSMPALFMIRFAILSRTCPSRSCSSIHAHSTPLPVLNEILKMRQIPDSGSPEQIFFEVFDCACAHG